MAICTYTQLAEKTTSIVVFRQGMRENLSAAVSFYILVIGDFFEGYKACELERIEV